MAHKMKVLMSAPNKVQTRTNSSYRIIKYVDGDPSKVEPVNPTYFDKRVLLPSHVTPHNLNAALKNGMPIELKHMPTKAMLDYKSPDKKLPDLFWYGGAEWFVCDQFKAIIEAIEPGVHQFFPMEMVWQGGASAGSRYLLNVCNRLDYIDMEHSEIDYHVGGCQATGVVYVFPEVAIGKALWRDSTFHSNPPWVADEAVEQIEAAGLYGAVFANRDNPVWVD